MKKNQKSKYAFWKKMKSFRKESVLIFKEKLGERGVLFGQQEYKYTCL